MKPEEAIPSAKKWDMISQEDKLHNMQQARIRTSLFLYPSYDDQHIASGRSLFDLHCLGFRPCRSESAVDSYVL